MKVKQNQINSIILFIYRYIILQKKSKFFQKINLKRKKKLIPATKATPIVKHTNVEHMRLPYT